MRYTLTKTFEFEWIVVADTPEKAAEEAEKRWLDGADFVHYTDRPTPGFATAVAPEGSVFKLPRHWSHLGYFTRIELTDPTPSGPIDDDME